MVIIARHLHLRLHFSVAISKKVNILGCMNFIFTCKYMLYRTWDYTILTLKIWCRWCVCVCMRTCVCVRAHVCVCVCGCKSQGCGCLCSAHQESMCDVFSQKDVSQWLLTISKLPGVCLFFPSDKVTSICNYFLSFCGGSRNSRASL